MTLDDFFRTYYRQMCRYCASRGFNFNDVEEQIIDVLLARYDEYLQACTERYGDGAIKHVQWWVNRRVMLDLSNLYARQVRYSREGALVVLPDTAHEDTPEAILDLKQRLPDVPQILIDYQQFQSDDRGSGGNGQVLQDRFKYERKKFLRKLAEGPRA